MGTHHGHKPMVEVIQNMLLPFNRPAMVAISLPDIQALTETVVMISG